MAGTAGGQRDPGRRQQTTGRPVAGIFSYDEVDPLTLPEAEVALPVSAEVDEQPLGVAEDGVPIAVRQAAAVELQRRKMLKKGAK